MQSKETPMFVRAQVAIERGPNRKDFQDAAVAFALVSIAESLARVIEQLDQLSAHLHAMVEASLVVAQDPDGQPIRLLPDDES